MQGFFTHAYPSRHDPSLLDSKTLTVQTRLADLEKAVWGVSAQVEAATGGQDVITFCGGLRAVLAAVGVPLHKALPSSLHPNRPNNSLTLSPDHDKDGAAASTVEGTAGRVQLLLCCSGGQQGQQPQQTCGRVSSVGEGAAVQAGTQQLADGLAVDQVSVGAVMPAAGVGTAVTLASAWQLHCICTASAQHLHSIYAASDPASALQLPACCKASV